MNSSSIHNILTPLIRTLPGNDRGRDFVVGDLHGCRRLLDELLAYVDFDSETDRLFSVGDLVDRGPDSMGCLGLLEEPWFYAVRGNHEVMLLDFVWEYLAHGCSLDRSKGHPIFQNGGSWIDEVYNFGDDHPNERLSSLLQRLQQLPFLIVVGEGDQRFHIVHSELYDASKPDEVLGDHDIDRLEQEWRDTDFTHTPPTEYPYFTQRWLWGRILMKRAELAPKRFPEKLPGLSPTYCGHTFSFQIREILSHICIDTGAFIAEDSHSDESGWGLIVVGIHEQKIFFTDGRSLSPQVSNL